MFNFNKYINRSIILAVVCYFNIFLKCMDFVYNGGVFFLNSLLMIQNTTISLNLFLLTLYIITFTGFINKFIVLKTLKLLITAYSTILIGTIMLLFTNNTLIFFIGYELVLVPSTLLVFLQSPNKRAFLISGYFLLWTQLGSFFVFVSVILLHVTYNITSFTLLYKLCGFFNIDTLLWLLFLGFGVKIPIWPFHYWLTKTHVEANTSFSIFLSGILVKTALIGLFKFVGLGELSNLLFIMIVFFGIIDVTFKLFYQTDFKKLIAFLTVQEMGLITILTFFLNSQNQENLLKFLILHTLLSSMLFLLNEVIYSRTGSRQTNVTFSLISTLPILSTFLYTITLLFIGLPLTLKFFIEVFLIIKFLNYSYFFYILFFIFVQFFTILFFLQGTVRFLFFCGNINKPDLSKVEFFLQTTLIITLLLVGLI